MQLSHASVNLPRLVKSLSARSTRLGQEDWAQVRNGQAVRSSVYRVYGRGLKPFTQTVEYARGLLKLVREENVVPVGKINTLERDLNDIAKAFDEAVKTKPIPSSSTTATPPALPTTLIPTSLLSQTAPTPIPSDTPPSSNANPTSTSPTRKLPIREASISLPALTTRESFLAEKEDEALLPLQPTDESDARNELFAGANGGGRGFRGAAQLHDELGRQLAEMSHQLKLNAVHFSKSLEDEKGILEQSTEVLSRNLDRTQISKKSLDSVRKKTGGTTWLTIISIIVVMVAFMWTYLLIRFT
ncbi:hypothetical protein QFC20_005201 [Naganishia adeliensis]|uniref:Uncharacterized protein n=1 Tax=Naganishia adeliensis TaxID=92952 RepID=A0ACC2VR58_9TREE|nr:hypothetical protein QFC20_005201 [Naganishia adeliensis]